MALLSISVKELVGKCKVRSEKLLACAGRETLLKSVVQSIPTYPMSTFLLTKKVCKSLTSPMANYFWSSSLDKKSLHWVSWKELATPKCKGGMGFRDPHIFNLAMLGKHGWRFITNPNSLCARVLKGSCLPDTDYMQTTIVGERSNSEIFLRTRKDHGDA